MHIRLSIHHGKIAIFPGDMTSSCRTVAHDVFISYSVKNQAQADEIYHELKSQGVSCWMAPHDVPPGTPNWPAAIAKAIRGCMEFVPIPAGEFMMGSNRSDDDEKLVHRVRISQPFYLGKYPVTIGQ